MRKWLFYCAMVLALFGLASCERMPAHHATAMNGLRVFCRHYETEWIGLTFAQMQAAENVCWQFGAGRARWPVAADEGRWKAYHAARQSPFHS